MSISGFIEFFLLIFFNHCICWFLHITSNESFKCNICEEHFQTRSNFMKHRKSKHRSMVQLCKNKKKCVFISSCWFLHEILDEQKINHKSDEKNKMNMMNSNKIE